ERVAQLQLVGHHHGERELEQVVVAGAEELGPEERREAALAEQGELVRMRVRRGAVDDGEVQAGSPGSFGGIYPMAVSRRAFAWPGGRRARRSFHSGLARARSAILRPLRPLP